MARSSCDTSAPRRRSNGLMTSTSGDCSTVADPAPSATSWRYGDGVVPGIAGRRLEWRRVDTQIDQRRRRAGREEGAARPVSRARPGRARPVPVPGLPNEPYATAPSKRTGFRTCSGRVQVALLAPGTAPGRGRARRGARSTSDRPGGPRRGGAAPTSARTRSRWAVLVVGVDVEDAQPQPDGFAVVARSSASRPSWSAVSTNVWRASSRVPAAQSA